MGSKFESLRTEYSDILRKSFKDKAKSTDLLEAKSKLFTKTSTDLKAPLDQAFRDLLLELLEREADVARLRELVDFSVLTCRKELSSPTMPVVLLSDIFDALTLDVCQEMFQYVENNVEVWKENLFFSCCKNNLLRLCNDLLRRLSRSTATVFCGRILLFLAKFFPFSERSGLNIVSEFNLENVTQYGADDAAQDAANDATETATGDGAKKVDFTFYCKFWSLQDFFRNPNQLYSKVQWKLFCAYASNVLSTFQGLKLEHVDGSSSLDGILGEDDNFGTGGVGGGGSGVDQIKDKMYFSKYLTSQKLLDLQLYDVNFRRAVLLQFLILFQYLSSNVKFKSDSFELKPDQKEWIQASAEKVYALLRETPPDGKRFAEIAANILSREEHWNAWKNDGCPELKKAAAISTATATQEAQDKSSRKDIEQQLQQLKQQQLEQQQENQQQQQHQQQQRRPLLGDLIKDATEQGKYYMGNNELTKLWNLCPDNLEACKGKERDFLPTLEEYFEDAINQVSSDAPVKDEDSLLKDGNYGWRALRLLAKRSPFFFTYSTIILNPLSLYLEQMVKKIASDRPQDQPETHVKDEEDDGLFKDADDTHVVDDTAEEVNIKSEFLEDDSDSRSGGGGRSSSKTAVNGGQLQVFSEKVAPDWEKLAKKLGFKDHEVQFFIDSHPDRPVEQARKMLELWFDDDEDATLDNFVYILEGLEMFDAAEVVRTELNSMDT